MVEPSRSYSEAILKDASVAAEPRREIRGEKSGAFGTAFGRRAKGMVRGGRPRLHQIQGALVFRVFRVFRGPKSGFVRFEMIPRPRVSHL